MLYYPCVACYCPFSCLSSIHIFSIYLLSEDCHFISVYGTFLLRVRPVSCLAIIICLCFSHRCAMDGATCSLVLPRAQYFYLLVWESTIIKLFSCYYWTTAAVKMTLLETYFMAFTLSRLDIPQASRTVFDFCEPAFILFMMRSPVYSSSFGWDHLLKSKQWHILIFLVSVMLWFVCLWFKSIRLSSLSCLK